MGNQSIPAQGRGCQPAVPLRARLFYLGCQHLKAVRYVYITIAIYTEAHLPHLKTPPNTPHTRTWTPPSPFSASGTCSNGGPPSEISLGLIRKEP